MREINFRGKNKKGEWIYGNLVSLYHEKDGTFINYYIAPEDADQFPFKSWQWQNFSVDPKTIGQFTGAKDFNGRKVYEGDVWRWGDLIGRVKFKRSEFVFTVSSKSFEDDFSMAISERGEVVGSVHDPQFRYETPWG
jgi:uncharacterized phage protein (TIGR01671 family)